MHFSTILAVAATALVQGSTATKVLVFPGRDCTGSSQQLTIPGNACVNSNNAFLSYRENGWGANGERIAFNHAKCNGGDLQRIYDTWAYNGDYFKSGKCYNLGDHTQNGQVAGNSILSYYP